MASLLAIAAALTSLTAAIWYNRDIIRGIIRPNLSSWAVWSCITILSSTSYFAASQDVSKSLIAFANSTATIATFGLILWRGRFSRVTRFDVIAGALSLVATAVWLGTRSAAWGNVILQVAIVIGCIPTYRSVIANPASERPGPWLLWTASFIIGAGVVFMRWTGHPLELAYAAAGLIAYGGVSVVILRGQKKTA